MLQRLNHTCVLGLVICVHVCEQRTHWRADLGPSIDVHNSLVELEHLERTVRLDELVHNDIRKLATDNLLCKDVHARYRCTPQRELGIETAGVEPLRERRNDVDVVRDGIGVLVETDLSSSVVMAVVVQSAVRLLEVLNKVAGALEKEALRHVNPMLASTGGETNDRILDAVYMLANVHCGYGHRFTYLMWFRTGRLVSFAFLSTSRAAAFLACCFW